MARKSAAGRPPRATRKAPAPRAASSGDEPWSVGLRIWIERRGRAVLGEGRADLLAGIDRTHSISAAARDMKMSYRHAWLMVQAVNQAAGAPLVESAVGGVKGGGARLTERGRAALDVYRRLTGDVRRQAADSLQRIVAAGAPTAPARPVLRIAAAISLQEAVAAVLNELTLAEPTARVHTLFGASNELAEQIAGGAPIDLLLTGDAAHAERLATEQLPPARAVRRLATNAPAVIVPTRSTLAARDLGELLDTDVARIAVADPSCPLGKSTAGVVAKLKLAERLQPRALVVDNSRGVPAAVRSGAAAAGIAFSSDAAQTADCRVLFPIRQKEAVVAYFGIVAASSRAIDEAAALLDFFVGDAAQRCFRRCGLGT